MALTAMLAIFVGGKSKRMGAPKGLLSVPGGSESILAALVRVGRDAGLAPVLVGDATPYAEVAPEVPRVEDEPFGAGPLAGLNASLLYAVRHGHSKVVAVACDMPRVSGAVLGRLAQHPSTAVVLAARRGHDAPWEPMLARYEAGPLVPVLDAAIESGSRSFQELFATLEVEALPLTPDVEQALEDWDTPEDIGA